MTDARAEDQEQVFGQPVPAQQPGWCGGCGKRILKHELIVEHSGSWLHYEGTCVDDFEAILTETDEETGR